MNVEIGVASVVELGDFQRLIAADEGNFVVAEVDNLVGEAHEGGGVAGQEKLVFADSDNQRRAFAGADNLVGVAGLDNGDGIGSDNLLQGLDDGIAQ